MALPAKPKKAAKPKPTKSKAAKPKEAVAKPKETAAASKTEAQTQTAAPSVRTVGALPTKPKKAAEALAALKAKAATQAEAQTAVATARALVEDPETPMGTRSLVGWYRVELEYATNDTARREALMAARTGIGSQLCGPARLRWGAWQTASWWGRRRSARCP